MHHQKPVKKSKVPLNRAQGGLNALSPKLKVSPQLVLPDSSLLLPTRMAGIPNRDTERLPKPVFRSRSEYAAIRRMLKDIDYKLFSLQLLCKEDRREGLMKFAPVSIYSY